MSLAGPFVGTRREWAHQPLRLYLVVFRLGAAFRAAGALPVLLALFLLVVPAFGVAAAALRLDPFAVVDAFLGRRA